jgi:chromosome segregation ATPase
MGREAVVTSEQVNAVADSMKAEGIKPTSRSVRERLGNIGSMGTINRLLQQWKARQVQQTTSTLALPPALQRAILDFMDQTLAAERAGLELELAEQQQEAADLATENERQADALAACGEQIESLSLEKAEAEGKAGQLAADLDAARADAAKERAGAEQARTELAKAQLRLEAMPRLESDLATIRAALDQERKARVAAEQSAAVLSAQKADLSERLAETSERAKRADEGQTTLQARADALAADLAEKTAALRAAQARAEGFEREAKAATADAERARGEAKSAAQLAAELRGKIEAADKPRGADRRQS